MATVDDVLELARLAPSAHNTQPWRVRVTGDVVSIEADETRHLAVTDPTRRDLHLALGAFVRALEIGAEACGFRADEVQPDVGAFAARRLVPAKPDSTRATLLRQRVTSRLAYGERPLDEQSLEALRRRASERGLRLHLFAQGAPDREKLEKWAYAASRESWLDPRAVEELSGWLRWDPEGLRAPEDGLSSATLGLSLHEEAALAFISRGALWRGLARTFLAPLAASALATSELNVVARAPAFGVLTAERDAHRAGGAFLDVWLEATKARLSLQPLSALLDRRGWEVARLVGVDVRALVALFRLGHSAPPRRSGRRNVRSFVAP